MLEQRFETLLVGMLGRGLCVLDKLSRLRIVRCDAERVPKAMIHFENLNFILDGNEKRVRALKVRPLPPRSLNAIARAHGVPCVVLTPGAIARFMSLGFVINNDDDAVRTAHARSSPLRDRALF